MANVLKREKQLAVLKLLVEGNSIRSTERITGVNRNTIMGLLVRFGNGCQEFLDLSLSNVHVEHIQCDEIWTFVGKKQNRLRGKELYNPELGDIYLFTALDTDTKLLVTYRLGKRTAETTDAFIADLEQRMVRRPDSTGGDRPQISTDGFTPYRSAIRRNFRDTIRHGILIKNYVNPEVGRYAPPKLTRASRINARGIRNLYTICTSHVERCNLTIRTFIKRFTRLALGFSKKLENLSAAVSLHIAHYNFCWRLREKGKSGKLRPTPAMMAGVVDTLWSLDDLYDAVTELQEQRKRAERYERLMRKIRSE